ncbi:hypothetical protein [Haloarcula sp. Atlit-120R]|uniref:DUF7260 family protein n=1 Tax=Haloarcula sp. Atlit-120R TaxID=2282135 RepID=UPI000EF1D2A0|nr:hypothetical protein [Haloarcula sp. Atlit-120R]RLM33082.1 hypothetical protein DVK01_17935 [Haloarcula sp. Atlit-120R]
MTRTPRERLERAVALVEEEQAAVEAERDAYRRFAKRLDAIEPTEVVQTEMAATSAATAVSTGTNAQCNALARIERAYRETVMATPDFEQQYGESFTAHFTREFGAELATRLHNARVLTPALYGGLQQAAATAVHDRKRYYRILRREYDSMTACAKAVQNIHGSLQEIHSRLETDLESPVLGTLDAELAELETKCDPRLTNRQQLVADRTAKTFGEFEDMRLTQYLYGELEVVYPALCTLAECLRTIRNCRQRCLQ